MGGFHFSPAPVSVFSHWFQKEQEEKKDSLMYSQGEKQKEVSQSTDTDSCEIRKNFQIQCITRPL